MHQSWVIVDAVSNQKLTDSVFTVEYFAHEFLLSIAPSERTGYVVIEHNQVANNGPTA